MAAMSSPLAAFNEEEDRMGFVEKTSEMFPEVDHQKVES